MKKIIVGLLSMVAFAGLQGDDTTSTKVTLYNNYGTEIAYCLNSPQEMRLSAGAEVELGFLNDITRLDIRTTGTGSGWGLSPYDSLMGVVKHVKALNIPNSAVISINDNTIDTFYKTVTDRGWHISVDWPTLHKFYLDNPQLRLKLIRSGRMGSVLKDSADKICNADYSKAMVAGKTNLMNYVEEKVKTTSYSDLYQFFNSLNKIYNSMKGQGLVQ